MLLPLATMQNLWNVCELGVAPSHHFWILVGFAALATECSTYFRGVLEDFLGIPPFQLCFEVTCSHFWGLRNLFLHFWVWLGLQGEWNICSIPAVFWWFYCRCFHFCTAPFRGCAMYSQVLGIGWVYSCSHGNGASIPEVFWCRSSPFCISRLHIYSDLFWPWSSWRAGTHTQELVRSMAVGFSFGALFARLFKSNWMPLWWLRHPLQNLTSTGRALFHQSFDYQKSFPERSEM